MDLTAIWGYVEVQQQFSCVTRASGHIYAEVWTQVLQKAVMHQRQVHEGALVHMMDHNRWSRAMRKSMPFMMELNRMLDLVRPGTCSPARVACWNRTRACGPEGLIKRRPLRAPAPGLDAVPTLGFTQQLGLPRLPPTLATQRTPDEEERVGMTPLHTSSSSSWDGASRHCASVSRDALANRTTSPQLGNKLDHWKFLPHPCSKPSTGKRAREEGESWLPIPAPAHPPFHPAWPSSNPCLLESPHANTQGGGRQCRTLLSIPQAFS